MKRILALLTLIFAIIGCESTHGVIGTYTYESKNTSAAHALTIEEDSTFTYILVGDLVNAEGTGFWSIDGNGNLILKSNELTKPGVISSIEQIESSKETVNIKIVDEFQMPLAYASVIVNGDSVNGFTTSKTGEADYAQGVVESMLVGYLGKTYHYKVRDIHANSILIKIKLDSESLMYFDSEKWKMTRNKLSNEKGLELIRQKGSAIN